MDLGQRGSDRELGGVTGEETVIRMYSMRESVFKRKKKKRKYQKEKKLSQTIPTFSEINCCVCDQL